MGKKDNSRKRRREDDEEDDRERNENPLAADPELEAELAAVAAIRAEKEGKESTGNNSGAASTYNHDGLVKCIHDFDTADLPFIQTMEINEFEFPQTNELDDMEREMNFYNHALMAVKSGYSLLQSLGVPVHRPHDFFCEQVKSDAHMAKIKDRLIMEEKRIEAFEKRKNREQSRKFNKQLSLLKKTEKHREEKHLLQEINTIKKSKDSNKDEKLEKILSSSGSNNHRDRPEKSAKRKAMDKKYGFGGKDRKRAKLNDSKSLNDIRDFNPRGGKVIRNALPKGRSGGSKGKGKPNRPGKAARAKARAGRK